MVLDQTVSRVKWFRTKHFIESNHWNEPGDSLAQIILSLHQNATKQGLDLNGSVPFNFFSFESSSLHEFSIIQPIIIDSDRIVWNKTIDRFCFALCVSIRISLGTETNPKTIRLARVREREGEWSWNGTRIVCFFFSIPFWSIRFETQ